MLQHYGYLKIRKQGQDEWLDRWILLKRPYVLVYMDEYETNEVDILNVQAVRVHPASADNAHVFTVYTTIDTYQCQAQDQDTMKEWVGVMI
ncbi:hypothetical protein BC940DRAFT_309217 [Gongronella butleri]|nr:hypothetical protein BC940DRAFT_309217 [Gongronella butleri]